MNVSPELSLPAVTAERVSASKLNALKWLQTTQAYIDHRVAQYHEVGNTKAADSLFDLQQQTLDFFKEGIHEGKDDFVDFLSQLEVTASDGRPYDSPNYVVIHGQQLDQLALATERAQIHHDEHAGSENSSIPPKLKDAK